MVKREYDVAMRSFEQAIAIAPEAPDGYIGAATVLQRQSKHEEVVKLLDGVVQRISSPTLHNLLADSARVLANRGRHELVDLALGNYQLYHESIPNPVSMFYAAELIFFRLKDPERALELYQRSWERDVKSREAFNGILKCLRQLGRQQEIAGLEARWKQTTK